MKFSEKSKVHNWIRLSNIATLPPVIKTFNFFFVSKGKMIPLFTFSLKNESVGYLKLHKIFFKQVEKFVFTYFQVCWMLPFFVIIFSVENKSHDLLATNRN